MKSTRAMLLFTLCVAFMLYLNLQHASHAQAALSTVAANTIEDNFTRANQTGWGTTTNTDSVPNVAWGADANGSQPYVSISNNTGMSGYQGSTNVVGLATAGTTTYGNGADTLISFTMSSVGHIIPYVLLNACANKSCYYSAQLHTSQNTLEIGERKKNTSIVLASVPFTASANTLYWMRLDTAADRSGTIEAKVWADGTPEPGWMVTGNDNNALAANYVGAGATWDVAGTGESVNFSCYAFNTGGNAALPCAPNPNATPTPTPTSIATSTPTPTPTSTGGPDSAHLIRSVNDSLFDTTDQLMNDPTTQAILKTHNTPIVRMPFRDALTDAQDLQALGAIENTGAAPLVIVHGACVSDPYTIDNHWLSLVAQVFTTGPIYVEYGNEEDLSCNGGAGISATAYQASWNVVVAQLKVNYPSYYFIGPVTYQSDPTYIATFVNGANPQPDFISWHEFVCSSSDSNSYCLSHINNWATHIANTNSAVQSAIGHTIPIMITEWNLDPGRDHRYSDQSFIQQWTTTALSEWSSLTSSGLYAAFNYTCESHPDFQLIDSSDNFTYQGAVFFL
ncbi:MAG TPA: hypothetical protein VKR06_23630 [Ktedonosporobacter sp.]|nr:hypothetical protein [Ktedonosporobacter sp.]